MPLKLGLARPVVGLQQPWPTATSTITVCATDSVAANVGQSQGRFAVAVDCDDAIDAAAMQGKVVQEAPVVDSAAAIPLSNVQIKRHERSQTKGEEQARRVCMWAYPVPQFREQRSSERGWLLGSRTTPADRWSAQAGRTKGTRAKPACMNKGRSVLQCGVMRVWSIELADPFVVLMAGWL